jgi:hypothetical protein
MGVVWEAPNCVILFRKDEKKERDFSEDLFME